jgi:hypothetical protein
VRNLLIASAALTAIVSTPAAADDSACPQKLTPELVAALGAPAAWLAPGQTVHRPAGLTVMGQPVAYVVARHAGGTDDGAITELDYRLQGATKPFGQRYPTELRKAFDKGYSGSDCGSQNSSCSIAIKGSGAGALSDAELSEGDLTLAKDAHGDALALVKADRDLSSADPVFLDCIYNAPK